MKKFKDIFSKTSNTLKNLFKKIPITLIGVIITTLIITVSINNRFNDDSITKIFTFGVIFSVQAFFIEMFFQKKHIKICGYILSAIASYIFVYLIFETMYYSQTTRILIGYLIVLFLMTIYTILKKEETKFSEYVLKLFANIFNNTIIYIVLNIGITLLSIVFIELILDGEYGNFLIKIQTLMLGLFYVPAVLNSIIQIKDKDVNVFIKGLVKYVLLPLAIIGILIIYLYIIKILLLQEIPSNIIFRILAGIFIFAFPVWNMAENFVEENKLIHKTIKILPYAYMPFIFLEIYSLGIRINEFGITPIRYFGIIFIILQVIALILTVIKKREKLPQIFIYTYILAVVSFIIPFVNYDTVSNTSQKNILVRYIKEETAFETLSEEDKQKASGAYRYLYYNDKLEYVPEYIRNTETEEKLKNYYSSFFNKENKIVKIYFKDEETNIDIKEYSNMIEVNQYKTSDISNILLCDNKENIVCNADLKEFINETIENNNKNMNLAIEYLNKNKIVKINDTKDLYINNFDLVYYSQTSEIEYLLINGYVLEKN